MSDKDTVEKLGTAARELQEKYHRLFDPYRADLWRFCLSVTKSPWDAEDLVQETLLKSFALLPYYFQPLNPKSYMFRIASNLWIDHCRKSKYQKDEWIEDSYPANETTLDDTLLIQDAMRHLLTNFSPRQAVIVLLIDVFDFTAQEVAAMLHTTEGAVKASLHRTRIRLRNLRERDVCGEESFPILENSHEHEKIITPYIQAFNDRDPDALAALLATEVEINIMNVSQELGRETARRHSLEGWSRATSFMRAEWHLLWGQSVLIWLESQDGQEYAITNAVRITVEDGVITRMKAYFFCPELLQSAGEALNLPVKTNGYHFR